MRALMFHQWLVTTILGMDDDQALADGEARSKEQQASV